MSETKSDNNIEIYGARVHNLKNVDVTLPRHSLCVITGLSGSGKSSLAFDTLYAEGQRRYIETFSAYARNFLDNLERPDVDKITGLSPVISIEQKTTSKNPRSTVGTVTEIYDFLRLLYARAAEAYSYVTGEKMVKYTEERIVDMILTAYEGHKVYLLAPLVRSRKGHYKELFETVRRKGFLTVRVDGELREATPGMRLDRYKNHDIEVVVDKLAVKAKDAERLHKSVAQTLQQGGGVMMVLDAADNQTRFFSKQLMDPASGIAYREPAPHNFSFNSAQGACPKCKGLGYVSVMDHDKVVPDDKLSIREGGLAPLGKYRNALIFWEIQSVLADYDCDLKTPICDLPPEALDEVFNGRADRLRIPAQVAHTTDDYYVEFDGLVKYIQQMADSDMGAASQRWAEQFSKTTVCPECHGARLNKEAMAYRFAGKTIAELSNMDIAELYDFLSNVEVQLDSKHRAIAHEILKELMSRLKFLLDVGLDYLSLSRSSMTLSGGESQRIRLATQIGSQLVNVLYILDEPSIGLHPRDTARLIRVLKELRDLGNTVIVVEHDEEIMRAADYIIDIGPEAGRLGGQVVYNGPYVADEKALRATSAVYDADKQLYTSHTLNYLYGLEHIPMPLSRRSWNRAIRVEGARANNLKGIDVDFPLNVMTVVTGVSGSGKSTLVRDIFYRALKRAKDEVTERPGEFTKLSGNIDAVQAIEFVDQNPIGRSSRSNAVTYVKAYDEIRKLMAAQPLAKQMEFTPAYFSFNADGGRCEECKGEGTVKVEMQFMADLVLECESCHGKRFKSDILEVKYEGKNIYDILEMTVNQAMEFFSEHNQTKIVNRLRPLQEVGLGYIKLGQSSSTLSGGENQRVKLAYYLGQERSVPTLFIFDEPTTGLHFHDINRLLKAFNALIERGHTIVIIEHNLDVIKCADYMIDLGLEGGREGGQLVACGTPEEVMAQGKGCTAKYLKEALS